MMPQRILPISQENPLWISWHDSNWIPILNPTNVMDYFSEKSNPFYDRTCNNEVVKMQRQSLDQLNNMTGVEYILLHVQDPILYVIRKQHRHSPTEATPMADYYIIAGIVYQAPDLATVFNSRLLSTVHNLQCAFEETSTYSRYHPSKGYSWDFTSNKALTDKTKSKSKKESSQNKEEPSSLFQKQRVDMLLGELLRKFPLPIPGSQHQQTQPIQSNTIAASNNEISVANNNSNSTANGTASIKTEVIEPTLEIIKQEPIDPVVNNGSSENVTATVETKDIKLEIKNEMKPPPEKKMK